MLMNCKYHSNVLQCLKSHTHTNTYIHGEIHFAERYYISYKHKYQVIIIVRNIIKKEDINMDY